MELVKDKYIVDEKGTKTAIVIPIKKYERLMEDIHDLVVIAERKSEPTISFDEMVKRLKTDGGL
jgi:hypothetical protein